MAAPTLAPVPVKLLVQVEDNQPLVIATIELPVTVTSTRGGATTAHVDTKPLTKALKKALSRKK